MFLKIWQYSQENTCVGHHLKKVAGLEARKSIKKRLQHRCFPMNIAKFLRTAFSAEQLWWLLLELRHFFSSWYIPLKFMKIVWHKHDLMISLSVDSGQSGKCSYEIPHDTYNCEGSSWGKLNVIASVIWFLFFK